MVYLSNLDIVTYKAFLVDLESTVKRSTCIKKLAGMFNLSSYMEKRPESVLAAFSCIPRL